MTDSLMRDNAIAAETIALLPEDEEVMLPEDMISEALKGAQWVRGVPRDPFVCLTLEDKRQLDAMAREFLLAVQESLASLS